MKRFFRTDNLSSRNSKAVAFARQQRAEANEFSAHVWELVRNRRCLKQKFRREHPIPPYTADFCCVELKLIVEIDGQHHLTEEGKEHDLRRDRFPAKKGYQVLRIPGYEVTYDPEKVRSLIEQAIVKRSAAKPPLPSPSPPNKVWGRGE